MSDTELLSSATPDAAPDNQPTAPAGGGFAQAPNAVQTDNGGPVRRRGGLTGMVLAELRQLAGQLGIADTSGMRKGDLIAAIKQRQGGGPSGGDQLPLEVSGGAAAPAQSAPTRDVAGQGAAVTATPPQDAAVQGAPAVADQPAVTGDVATGQDPAARPQRRRGASRPAGAPDRRSAAERHGERSERHNDGQPGQDGAGAANSQVQTVERTDARPDRTDRADRADRADRTGERDRAERDRTGDRDRDRAGDRTDRDRTDRDRGDRDRGDRDRGDRDRGDRDRDRGERGDRDRGERGDRADRADRGDRNNDRTDRGDRAERDGRNNDRADRDRADRADQGDRDDDEDGGGRRRGRRFRDRRRNRGERRPEGGSEPEVREDDVLLPVAGILDVLENYAFVRTSGYLSGPNDVYVSLSLVRKYGLRRGDAITGAVRQPRDGEQQRQKFNPLVRVDTINGLDNEAAKQRPEFTKLTPLYPNERLRLETEPHKLTTRVIDLVMPIGKGQRALIVSPPKAGKTMVLQAIANAITTNNPECHLMVVLVDERPEEVTDMQRSVKGEVIASTFDRPPSDHTTASELAIERAKRLVEMGHDVVVLLDSITRLGRAYNLAAPASGRILSGGVDSTALYPPKRFLGAARNIEGGGSLTIFATALVETGSTGDSVIYEEFKGTGNAELKLDRKIADRRVFPAVDVTISGTRKEELLLSPDEMAVIIKLRRVLTALDPQQGIDLVLDRLRKTRTNIEFLMQVAKTTPLSDDD